MNTSANTIINLIGVPIEFLNPKKFAEKLSSFRKDLDQEPITYNGFYIYEVDLVLIRNTTKCNKDYLILHELVHAIRSSNRMGVARAASTIPVTMRKKLSENSYSPMLELSLDMAKSDIGYWREEAIADWVSIFICTELDGIKRNKIHSGRIIAAEPLCYVDIYADNDKKRFISTVKKEGIFTLEYIIDNYLLNFKSDKKLLFKKFSDFIEAEFKISTEEIMVAFERQSKELVN